MFYPWQQAQWESLLAAYHQDRLPHALLIAGPIGLGKLAFAQAFAQYLLCTQKDKSRSQACGECADCRLMAVNNHPDLKQVSPEETSDIIKIEQVRQLVAMLSQTSQRAGYQVVILYPAETLNKAASNALLKTVEEPTGRVVFLLVSHQPGILSATLLSRCQRILLTGEKTPEKKAWVNDQLQALDKQADTDLLLKIAEYAPLRAVELANQQYLDLRDQLLRDLLNIYQAKTTAVCVVEAYLKQDLRLCLNALASLVTDVLRLQLNAASDWLVNSDRLSQLNELKKYPLNRLLGLLTELNQARKALLNSQIHLNTQLLLENLWLIWEAGRYANDTIS